MSRTLFTPIGAAPQTPESVGRPDRAALSGLLDGHHRVLCAINPDAIGREVVDSVAVALRGRDCRLGIVSAARFEMPLDASACLRPTPLDRRARLIVDHQRKLDRMVRELGLRDAEVFATAGMPREEIHRVAELWRADLVLFARAARTGLKPRSGNGSFAVAAIDDACGIAHRSVIARLLGA